MAWARAVRPKQSVPGEGGWGHGQDVSSFEILRFQLAGRLRVCRFLMGGSVFEKGEAWIWERRGRGLGTTLLSLMGP